MHDTNPLARYLVPLRRWWPVLVGTLTLGLVIAWFTLPERPEELAVDEQIDPEVAYRATEILIRGRNTPTTQNFDLVLLLARQGEVANMVAERMDGQVPMADIEAVELSPDSALGTLSVSATQPTSDLAVELVDTYSEALTDFFDDRADASTREQIQRATEQLTFIDDRIRTLEQEIQQLPEGDLDRRLLESETEVLVGQYGALQAEISDLSTRDLAAGPSFESLQEPVPVSTEASLGPQVFDVPDDSPMRFVLAALAALLVGVALVFAVDWADTRVRTRSDAEEFFGLPVVAELPYRRRRERRAHPVAVHTDPSSATAEAMRRLLLSLQNSPIWRLDPTSPIGGGTVGSASTVRGGPRQALLVASAHTGEGKSTVTADLAAAFAASGSSVLVIDCDFRRPSVATLLGLEEGPGLRELREADPERITALVRTSAVPGVEVLRSGSPGIAPPWFLSDTSALVQTARERADVVIVDAGPMLATNEAGALVPYMDAVLLVNRSGRIARDQATRTTEQLARLSAKVAGVVMVGTQGGSSYGYYQPIRRAAEHGEKLDSAAAVQSQTSRPSGQT